MFFDDRLTTVLRQRAQSEATRRTQFRQLLDLMGAPGGARDASLVAAAWLRLDWLAEHIPAADRARMIREPGWRLKNPELVAHLAAHEAEVAAAALSRAQLGSEDWRALIPRLPVRARGFLRLRRDLPVDVEALLERLGVHDRGLPGPAPAASEEVPVEVEVEPNEDAAAGAKENEPFDLTEALQGDVPPARNVSEAGEDPQARGRSEISALVERIAQFRRSRGDAAGRVATGSEREDDSVMPRLPLGDRTGAAGHERRAFGFATDAAGRIEWAEAPVAAMVTGARLVPPARLGAEGGDTAIARAFRRRQPIRAARMTLSGAPRIAGEWVLDAQPRFTEDGHFAGYVGRFRRPPADAAGRPGPAQREADRIRQLLHELRTPITAIQGYSEVIQQQMFGSAPHEYRALAAAIASDAARILSGFEELDRLARLETGVMGIGAGETDLAALTRRTVQQLAQVLGPRLAGIELDLPDGEEGEADPHALAAIDDDAAQGLLWRLLATLGGGCAAGEMLAARIERERGMLALICELPAQLLGEEDVFAAEARPVGTAINPGLFGAGFALRLARAEARAVGGELVRVKMGGKAGDAMKLTLPAAGVDGLRNTRDLSAP
jgi:signal transduction histidine kinase